MLKIYQLGYENGPVFEIAGSLKVEIERLSTIVQVYANCTSCSVWRSEINRLKKGSNKDLLGCKKVTYNDLDESEPVGFDEAVVTGPIEGVDIRYFAEYSGVKVPLKVPQDCLFELSAKGARTTYSFGKSALEARFAAGEESRMFRLAYESLNSFQSDMLSFDELLWRRYGAEIGFWIERRFAATRHREAGNMVETDCYRIAEVGNESEEREFENMRGCCGSFEAIIEHGSGRKFRIGFNYGH